MNYSAPPATTTVLHFIIPYNPTMIRIVNFLLAAALFTGCASSEDKAPRLASKLELRPNVGQTVRIEGIARYQKATGPMIAGDDFQIRVYPRTAWGPELDGKKIELTGRLNDSAHATPPDPSLNPGEYWLGESTWKIAVPETK